MKTANGYYNVSDAEILGHSYAKELFTLQTNVLRIKVEFIDIRNKIAIIDLIK